MNKIGFGGGCHWCTESVFQTLKGIDNVEQGWIASDGENNSFSEGVIVHFDERIINLHSLVTIHLHTHSSTADHSLRNKYRSAVYTYTNTQTIQIRKIISDLQTEFDKPIITRVLPFQKFKTNKTSYQDYYLKHARNQFCTRYINPKFKLLMDEFLNLVDSESNNIKEFKSLEQFDD